MAERISGTIVLWDGWRLRLPNDCMAERNEDGSWSAWDATHVIDVHIVTADAPAGRSIDAVTMLGSDANVRGTGWLGHVREVVEEDADGAVFRLAVAAAVPNGLLSCWIAYRDGADRPWADEVLHSIEHDAAAAGR